MSAAPTRLVELVELEPPTVSDDAIPLDVDEEPQSNAVESKGKCKKIHPNKTHDTAEYLIFIVNGIFSTSSRSYLSPPEDRHSHTEEIISEVLYLLTKESTAA